MRKAKKKEKLKLREKEKLKGKRGKEEEKEQNESVTVKRRCEALVSLEALVIFEVKRERWRVAEMFSWEDILDNPEDLSDCEPDSCAYVRVVPDVTDMLVSPSSVVTELCDVSPCGSDWELVEPQSFSFSQKRAHCGTDTQEEMSTKAHQ